MVKMKRIEHGIGSTDTQSIWKVKDSVMKTTLFCVCSFAHVAIHDGKSWVDGLTWTASQSKAHDFANNRVREVKK